MAQLEMCFPPSFFDIMPHLMVHMVPQMQALGPMYLHQMWTYERFISILNRYVLNRAHPEGSIIEGYSTEEVIECCQDYLKEHDKKAIGLPVSRHVGRLAGKGTMGKKMFIDKEFKEVEQVHSSVLQYLTIMEPYIEQHMNVIREESAGRSDDWIVREHKRRFSTWLREQNLPDGETQVEKTIKRLASGPSSQVTSWQAYDINAYRFYTNAKDKKSVSQNSGVRIEAIDTMGQKSTYYGFIDDIWELDYGSNIQIPVFRCQWVKHPNGVEVDNFGLTRVNLSHVGHKDDPWVLANRVAQVFYVLNPDNEKKHIVVSGKQRIIGVDGVEDVEDYNQYDEMELFTDLPNKVKLVEASIDKKVMPWVRIDGEGKIVNG